MDERVSRRGLFRKLLTDSVDALGRILSDAVHSSGPASPHHSLTPEEAGHMLRFRKTMKKGFHIDTVYPQKSGCESNRNNS